jgi:hypothetical protein
VRYVCHGLIAIALFFGDNGVVSAYVFLSSLLTDSIGAQMQDLIRSTTVTTVEIAIVEVVAAPVSPRRSIPHCLLLSVKAAQ